MINYVIKSVLNTGSARKEWTDRLDQHFQGPHVFKHTSWPHLIATVLILVNSLRPNSAHSRPRPDVLVPPKGKDGSERTKSLTKHIPASISETASSLPFCKSFVNTAAPRPNSDWLASSTACASLSASMIGMRGPNTSSPM